jgi:hypothetical protein
VDGLTLAPFLNGGESIPPKQSGSSVISDSVRISHPSILYFDDPWCEGNLAELMSEATSAVHWAGFERERLAMSAPRLGTRLQVGLVAQQAKASSNAIAHLVPVDALIARESRRNYFSETFSIIAPCFGT